MSAPVPACGGQNNFQPIARPSLPSTIPVAGPSLPANPRVSTTTAPTITSAGRLPPPLFTSTLAVRPPVLLSRVSLSTSNSRPGASNGDASSSAASAPKKESRRTSRPPLRILDPGMTTYSTPSPLSPPGKAVLHKRAGSGSSSPFSSQTQFATPYATYEEPENDLASILTPKIKPYLRKMSASAAKEDQGYVDLSKSVSENERLSGLGIQDFGTRAMTDSALSHQHTRGHDRTLSVGSQVSIGSNSFKANQPFTHPMKQTPRPYNAPAGISYASSVADEEEHDDVVADDFQSGPQFRSRRSMSISSMATTSYPTPLSQSYTPNDLDLPTTSAPRLLGLTHSNHSAISTHSTKSKIPAASRSRRVSTDLSPSIRSSFDQAFSFSPRHRSSTETSDPPLPAPSREERIRAARRKFEEKEASKDRKAARARESKLAKRSSRSSHPSRTGRSGSGNGGSPLKKPVLRHSDTDGSNFESDAASAGAEKTRRGERKINLIRKSPADSRDSSRDEKTDSETLQSRSYASHRPTHPAAMPQHVLSVGLNEKSPRVRSATSGHERGRAAGDSGSWLRFSTWLQTRMLSCGGRRD